MKGLFQPLDSTTYAMQAEELPGVEPQRDPCRSGRPQASAKIAISNRPGPPGRVKFWPADQGGVKAKRIRPGHQGAPVSSGNTIKKRSIKKESRPKFI